MGDHVVLIGTFMFAAGLLLAFSGLGLLPVGVPLLFFYGAGLAVWAVATMLILVGTLVGGLGVVVLALGLLQQKPRRAASSPAQALQPLATSATAMSRRALHQAEIR